MKIGIIGLGHLGSSLLEGLLRAGVSSPSEIAVCEHPSRVTDAIATYNVRATSDVNEVLRDSEAVFLTVKGAVFEELSSGIDRAALSDTAIISFMAGVPFEKLRELLGDIPLIRAMPSLAIATCEGVIGYTPSPDRIAQVFHKLGYAFETTPEDIEKVMAFSSCGLGFAAYLIDAFASAGTAMGFSPETAERIATMTFRNAIDRGNYKPTVAAVATPGGATEQGVNFMNDNHVYEIIAGAVGKAYDRMK
jgi:pyrroline-5-carboxylate reductase